MQRVHRIKKKQFRGIVLGVMILIAGAVLNFDRISSFLTWTSTTGKVTEAQTNKIPPQVSYSFSLGEKSYSGKSDGEENTVYEVGAELPIFYDPSDPSHNAMKKFDQVEFIRAPGGFLLIMGSVMLVGSTLSFFLTGSRVRR